jgi:hypothetical protein
MLVALLAVLLAGDQPADSAPVQTLPIGRSMSELVTTARPLIIPRLPASLAVSAGWTSWETTDPFGRVGPSRFRAPGPSLGIRAAGSAWYADFAGQLMRSSLAHRNLSASVARDIASIGPVRIGLSAEAAEVRFRREDFRTNDILVGTSRTATLIAAGVSLGVGSYQGPALRVTALGGWYQNRYGSIVELPEFIGDEPLADDEKNIYGAKVSVERITIAGRVQVSGSARYLRLAGPPAYSVPSSELSGTASVNIRLFGIRRKQLFVGALARFGPEGPSLITDKTFGLRGIWKFR